MAQPVWGEWSFEPGVIAGLAASAGLYGRGLRALWRNAGAGHGIRHREAAGFAAGLVTVVIALMSPLDALGDRLFAAHMVEHELLMAVAAPLLVLGRPLVAFLWAVPVGWRRTLGRWTAAAPVRVTWGWLTRPVVATTIHGVVIWVWHLPRWYDAAVDNEAIHALQHAAFLGTALLFWWVMLDRVSRRHPGLPMLCLFITMVHTGALGALLTFAPAPLYPAYTGLPAWGLSALEDQQLAGLIMWIPAGAIYLGATVALAARWLRDAGGRGVSTADAVLP